MYAQIGDKQFTLLTGFESFSRQDDTTYAKHDLISGKPRLQPVANELEQISISIRLRAEFTNVEQSIITLKKYKDEFEVLPFILGNGRYLGDYVIISLTESHNHAFEDGQLIDASISLTIQEYSVTDKLQQQQQQARKNAFAVGDKQPVLRGAQQATTIHKQATVNLSRANSEGASVASQVINYENNPSQANSISKDIEHSTGNITTQLNEYNDKLDGIENIFDDADAVSEAIQNVLSATGDFVFPVPDLATLQTNNLQLQSALQQLNILSTPLNYTVISRRA